MPDLRSMLEGSQEAILLGEFGGLLHMFGKASREFLEAHATGGAGNDTHQEEKHFGSLLPLLKDTNLVQRFTFGTEKLATDFTDFFRRYKKYKGQAPDSHLLKLLNACHRMTSADEKGVVRRPQSVNSIQIMTPFGHVVQPVKVDQIDAIRGDLVSKLTAALQDYGQDSAKIQHFRGRVIETLQLGMSQTLGETREPANDVTLWAQSFGVASLYKSTLAAIALGKDPCPRKNNAWDYNGARWRLFGIGWNGAAFVQRGRKPADIIERQTVLVQVRQQLVNKLEIQTPLGNLFYADLNGAFFTFPGIDKDASCELLKDLGPGLIAIIRQESDNELWPFLTLSRPRRTLTSIAQQISTRDRFVAAPCTTAELNLEDDGSHLLLAPGPCLKSASQHDVCPVCRVRGKTASDESCVICRERRSGRQSEWLQHTGGETIWMDEIADTGSRLALLTLRVDLAPWLSGERLSTVLSQALQDWWDGPKMLALRRDQAKWAALQNPSSGPHYNFAVHCLRKSLDSSADAALRAAALDTFFEDVSVSKANLQTHLDNIRQRIDDAPNYTLSAEHLAQFVFTQNASPGRLMRTWEAADAFIESLIESLRTVVFASPALRVSFR
ncbi:MAG TPA: CRISPR-associated protein Csx11, partial [Bryobacteraceae bacterium]|nr:CRISPR-associated protein Csx11 [Bryobacteraceae bacterium]